MQLIEQIKSCQICADKFALTATAHMPRPVTWFSQTAKILIAGQAPGKRVHESGKPFTDPSGDRLRDWLGVSDAQFYDRDLFAILPMAFCFPGYNAKGHDLAPPKICAKTWRKAVLAELPQVSLQILVGTYAQSWHLNDGLRLSDRLAGWRDYAPRQFVLPHPSWRNNAWLKKNPWFERHVIPALQTEIAKVLRDAA